MPGGDLTPLFRELITLERQVSAAAKAANPANEMRVYPWRPSRVPELPAIWNWIDDGTYDVVDTARGDDIIVITATIGVKPSDLGETMDRLVLLADHFRNVVDPALRPGQPLSQTSKEAKRVGIFTRIDEFNDIPVMCMDLPIRVRLSRIVA